MKTSKFSALIGILSTHNGEVLLVSLWWLVTLSHSSGEHGEVSLDNPK